MQNIDLVLLFNRPSY